MSDTACDEFSLDVLDSGVNRAYRPQPIPAALNGEISKLLSQVIDDKRVARFERCLQDGHAVVLRVFAERAA
jgi:hypothetical protein